MRLICQYTDMCMQVHREAIVYADSQGSYIKFAELEIAHFL